jgi:hypothetical protein
MPNKAYLKERYKLFGGTSQTLLQFLVSENAMETTFHHSSL